MAHHGSWNQVLAEVVQLYEGASEEEWRRLNQALDLVTAELATLSQELNRRADKVLARQDYYEEQLREWRTWALLQEAEPTPEEEYEAGYRAGYADAMVGRLNRFAAPDR